MFAVHTLFGRYLPGLLLALGVLASLVVWRHAAERREAEAAAILEARLHGLRQDLRGRLEGHLAQLHATRAWWLASRPVEPAAWRPMREAWWGERPWLTGSALDFLPAAEAERLDCCRAAVVAARDGGEATLAALPGLTAADGSQLVFFLPVYRPGPPGRDLAARRAAWLGCIRSRVAAAEMFSGLLAFAAGHGLRLALSMPQGAVVLASPGFQPAPVAGADGAADLGVPGERPLALRLAAAPPRATPGQAWGTLAAGLALSGVLAALVALLARDRRRQGEALAKQRALFTQALDALPVCVFLKTPEGRLVFANVEAAATLGRAKGELPGRFDFDVLPEALAGDARAMEREVLAQRRPRRREARVALGGVERDLVLGCNVVAGPEGETLLLVFALDMSELKRAQAELESQSVFHRRILDSLPSQVYVQSVTGRLLYVNRAFADFHGRPAASLPGLDLGVLYVSSLDAAVERQLDEAVTREGRAVSLDRRITLASGEERWFDTSKRPIRRPDGSQALLAVATDITERRRLAEQASRARANQLSRAVTDALGEGVVGVDGEARVSFVNPMAERLLGLAEADLLGRPARVLLGGAPGGDAGDGAAAGADEDTVVERVLASGIAERREGARLYRGDGGTFPVAYVCAPILEAGRTVGAALSFQDISERLARDAALRISEQRFRLLFERAPLGIGIARGASVLLVNPAFLRMLGYESALEIAGKSVLDFVEPGQRGLIQARIEARRRGEAPSPALVTQLRRRDGGLLDCYAETNVIELEDGPAVLAFMTDISALRDNERALRESERRLRAILDNITDMAWLKDADSRYVAVNEATAGAAGLRPEDFVGRGDEELWPADLAATYRRDDREIMASGERKRVEEMLEDRQGRRYWIETIKSPIVDADGRVIGTAGIARDISERKAREAELGRHLAELARMNAELDEFTYVASHDLQEPARKLVAFSEWLRQDLGSGLPERAAQDLDFIVDAAQRLHTLIQDLLTLSRAGKMSMMREPVALDDAVDAALDHLSMRLAETGARVERQALPVVRGDRVMLTQLYQNLIGNAVKFVAPGEAPRVRLTAERGEGEWRLAVADEGIGIRPDYAEQIFQPFRRLHGRGQYEGSGVGLSICRKVVERHGGRIWLDPAVKRGACFRFSLPLSGDADPPPGPGAVRKAFEPRPSSDAPSSDSPSSAALPAESSHEPAA